MTGSNFKREPRNHPPDGGPAAGSALMLDSVGGPRCRRSAIQGIRVLNLADLLRANLNVGRFEISRAYGFARVTDLIEPIPLRKEFAAKFPAHPSMRFEQLVDQVHGQRRTSIPPGKFWIGRAAS